MENKDKPAYPVNLYEQNSVSIEIKHLLGLTKREIFAMAAMQGLCSNSFYAEQMDHTTDIDEILSRRSIEIADKLLKQLEL